MPELPEVEFAREVVSQYCLNQTITSINMIEQGNGPRHGLFDEIICECAGDPKKFENAMVGKTLVGMHRKGKQMWMTMSGKNSSSILFHFGMTGSFVVKDKEKFSYKSFKIDDEDATTGERIWPPRFTKMEIIFSNGMQVAFCDPRRLGRIRIRTGDPRLSPPISDLARDPILDGIDLAIFTAALAQATCPIKAILMDQNKIFCGLGNWVCDEVLYQAGINPATPCHSINNAGVKRLANSITHVLTTAIDCNRNRKHLPLDWLFHYRWGKGKGQNSPGTPKLPNGRQVSHMTVGGRTSAYVSALQPRYGAYNMFEDDLAVADDDNRKSQGEAAAATTTPKKRKQSSNKNETTAAPKKSKQAK